MIAYRTALLLALMQANTAACLASEPADSAGDFFTPPGPPAIPRFRDGEGRAGLVRKLIESGPPTMPQVQQIPGLSPGQRREIKRLYETAREELKSRRQELQAPGGAGRDQAALARLRAEIEHKRLAVWQKVQAILTPEQLRTFEMMRKGELTVAGIGRR